MTMRPNSLQARGVAAFIHPYTNLKAHEANGPMVIKRGRGIHVYDDDGKEYIEGLASLWYASLGFDEERLIEAATRQLRELPTYHVFASKSHEPGIELAERLVALAPVPMSKARSSFAAVSTRNSAMPLRSASGPAARQRETPSFRSARSRERPACAIGGVM